MSYSYDDVYVLHAWRDNRRRLVLTQGEGYSGTITDNDVIKAPRFQLRDERDVIEIPSSGNPSVQLAVTRSNHTEDLLTCTVVDRENGIIACPITKSLTDVAGEVKGEIRLITGNAVTKFYGVDFYVFNGVSDSAIAQSSQFSALVQALQQVNAIITGGSSGTISLDTVIQHNGTKPVASGIIYDYLVGDYLTYLRNRFTSYKYAHTVHSSSYDEETNPIDDYGDTTFEGVYIDNAIEIGVCYIIKNKNGARIGVLFCASVPTNSNTGVTQIAMLYYEQPKWRYRHTNGTWDDWTYLELQKNKDLYNSADETYFGITNDDTKYPSAKAVYKFIQANAQTISDLNEAIKNNLLLGYDTLTIDKEYDIHKETVETYLNDSDYSQDLDYTISTLDNFDFGYEIHGRPNKIAVPIPSGGTTIAFRDTVSGRQWSEATESTTYIQNLIPNRIYVYQILDANGVVLKVGTAKANGKVRMINAGGDTYNIRDIGGWDANGGKLKYGVIYRGGELNSGISITSAQQSFFRDALGIRDEIDLRSTGYGETALGVGVDYLSVPLPYAPNIFNESHYSENAAIIKRIAYDIANGRPVYIHCQAGADRTGMVCLYLEAICGVSQNDIDRDYELTSFSKEPGTNNNWTNRILRKRNSTTSYHLKNIVSIISAMEGNNFNDKVVRFLLRTGVSIDEINTIRFGLIDGNPTKLTNPYDEVTITKTLPNITIDNQATTMTKYQPFEATLSVDDFYKLTSLSITMGGTNAISYYSNGKISIPIVTGNIVISATTTPTYETIPSNNSDKLITSGGVYNYVLHSIDVTLQTINWSNNTQSLNLSQYEVTENTVVILNLSDTAFSQLDSCGCESISAEIKEVNNTSQVVITVEGETPTVNITIGLLLTEAIDLNS